VSGVNGVNMAVTRSDQSW